MSSWQLEQFEANFVAPLAALPGKLVSPEELLLDELLLDELLLDELLLDELLLDELLLDELLFDELLPDELLLDELLLDELLLDELLLDELGPSPPQAVSIAPSIPIINKLRIIIVAPHLALHLALVFLPETGPSLLKFRELLASLETTSTLLPHLVTLALQNSEN